MDTSGQLDDLERQLEALEPPWFDYVWERSQVNTDAAAYKAIGISRSGFYLLDATERERLNTLAKRLRKERILHAEMALRRAVVEAATVKVAGLQNRDPRIKQASATEILDRVLGKPITRADITSGGERIVLKWPEDGD